MLKKFNAVNPKWMRPLFRPPRGGHVDTFGCTSCGRPKKGVMSYISTLK